MSVRLSQKFLFFGSWSGLIWWNSGRVKRASLHSFPFFQKNEILLEMVKQLTTDLAEVQWEKTCAEMDWFDQSLTWTQKYPREPGWKVQDIKKSRLNSPEHLFHKQLDSRTNGDGRQLAAKTQLYINRLVSDWSRLPKGAAVVYVVRPFAIKVHCNWDPASW